MTTPDPLQQQKEVEFHAGAVAAWFNTSLERDKSLFALSAGSIGLLVTLMTTIGVTSVVLLVLNIIALVFFLLSLVAVLAIFQRNRTHIEQVLKGNPAPDTLLTVLDHLAIGCFLAGALLTAVIGISAALVSYSGKEKAVATENKQITNQGTEQKSFNNLGDLQQSGQQQGQAPAPVPPAPAPSPPSGPSSSAKP